MISFGHLVAAWLGFMLGWFCSLLYGAWWSRRRIKQDLWQQIHSVSGRGDRRRA